MKRLLLLSLMIAVVAGAIVILPQGVEPLNPNHDCAFCHKVHGATGFGSLLNAATVEALCLSCHSPAGSSTLKADVHTNDSPTSYPDFRITCNECHESHTERGNWLGGTNIKLAGRQLDGTGYAKINTTNSGIRNVVFESRGSDVNSPTLHSFADADEDGNSVYDGVCEMCHTLTQYHLNNSNGNHTHYTGETCTRSGCHVHVDNFNP